MEPTAQYFEVVYDRDEDPPRLLLKLSPSRDAAIEWLRLQDLLLRKNISPDDYLRFVNEGFLPALEQVVIGWRIGEGQSTLMRRAFLMVEGVRLASLIQKLLGQRSYSSGDLQFASIARVTPLGEDGANDWLQQRRVAQRPA